MLFDAIIGAGLHASLHVLLNILFENQLPQVGNVTDTLRRIYLLFVELVVRNPSHVPGTSPINVPSFALKLEALITGLPWFA